MIRKVLILANSSIYEMDDRFDKSFGPLGEYVSELSHLYTILKERSVELILIPDVFPGINQGIIRRLRLRSPMADIWEIVQIQGAHLSEDGVFDGGINLGDGPEEIAKTVRRILYQKELMVFGM